MIELLNKSTTTYFLLDLYQYIITLSSQKILILHIFPSFGVMFVVFMSVNHVSEARNDLPTYLGGTAGAGWNDLRKSGVGCCCYHSREGS